ncbi:hypothetical protein I553_3691 [Mycobacterium xenopi 4042]|uniref:Uncharacterized protein n=1 Tax=Mycobacterium xenopi 4042 TaxID=1299334 RepID=X7YQV4_MYCXE|nr:hypothetical protein I553_3691 [Mycobacterium xenopi 4042]
MLHLPAHWHWRARWKALWHNVIGYPIAQPAPPDPTFQALSARHPRPDPRNPKESWYRPADHPRPTAPHSAASQNNRVDGNTKSPIHGFRLRPVRPTLQHRQRGRWASRVRPRQPFRPRRAKRSCRY